MASDRALKAQLRKELGLTDSTTTPDSDLQTEVDGGKQEITNEVQERLNNGALLDFDGAAEEALLNFLRIRLSYSKPGSGTKDSRPGSISVIRRTDFQDENRRFWRDRLVAAISRIQ